MLRSSGIVEFDPILATERLAPCSFIMVAIRMTFRVQLFVARKSYAMPEGEHCTRRRATPYPTIVSPDGKTAGTYSRFDGHMASTITGAVRRDKFSLCGL